MPNKQIQSLTVEGVTYDIVDNTSGYINAQYIENKTDYSIPVSRVGEIEVGETAIGTDSTNFPTSKAVVDYVDERVVQEMDAIDVGVTGIKANGTSLSIVDGVVNIPAIGPNQSIGLMTDQWMQQIWNELNSIPTSTSQLTNDSGFITASDIPISTDEKLAIDYFSHSSITSATYYPILGKNSNSIGSAARRNYDSEFKYDFINGRTVDLYIGSSKFTGRLSLKNNDIITRLIPSATTTYANITLPAISGTLALTSDIPTVPTNISSFTNDSGYLTASDIASVMTYKGTKANYAALPASGNTTGDVWHITDTGAEWAWDGSTWQELGTAIDLSNYATKATTLAGYGITDAKIQNGTITLGSNTITPLTSYTETDPTVPSWAKAASKPSYTASEVGAMSTSHAANGITTAKINAWDAKSDFSGSYNDLTDKPTIPTVPTNISAFTNDSGYLTSYTETDPTVPSWAKASSKPSYGLTEISGTDDLRAIEALTGTSGLLKKTAANTWTLDTNTYLTSYTETDPVFSASAAAGITATDISNWNGKTSNTGTVTSITVSNATNGGLSISGSPISTSGTITIGHSNVLSSAQTTQAVYPIKIDKNGHISAYGSAVTIPTVYSSTNTSGYLTMATLPIYDGTVV